MKLIIPCAGQSTRFPGIRPKWMLSSPQGNLMVEEALKGLTFDPIDLVFVILQDHENNYKISNSLKDIFGHEITIVILEQNTSSQPETVYRALKKINVLPDESIFIKDSDNYFLLHHLDFASDYICIDSLDNHPNIKQENKGYCQLDATGNVVKCFEKEVVSKDFSVGGYFFKKSSDFLAAYEEVEGIWSQKELYVTHIINHLTQRGRSFSGRKVENYVDWGTQEDWNKYCEQFSTYIVDIDGVLVRNSAEHFPPYWGETEGITSNIDVINSLHAKGNRIILLTSRKESFRHKTIEQLERYHIKYDQLLMDCLHGKRYLINDFSNSNPFPTSVAINIERNSSELSELINGRKTED